jgi:hypothetical protein
MRTRWWALLLGAVLFAGCGPRPLTSEGAVRIDRDVRAFALAVAQDVTKDGPLAWPKYLDGGPSFFLAANGQWGFRDGASVAAGMQSFASAVPHVELHWGDDLRVDPLTPDLAVMAASYREIQVSANRSRTEQSGFFTGTLEYRDGRWRFRNQHWSVPGPPVR